ncbi:ankyrin repeat-containing protein At5g02620-like [Cannabis sativa]|uniref:ankyrin repeat-containing protein At5g02620-like n=1 Tax=Cannabis sativa TaxID=3483 RepID=UPI0029CA11C7|nr:ankyrin repeat-containing protein At5g02620-like [Cannabis sativa]
MELISSIEDGECSNDENILNFLNAVKSGNKARIQDLLKSSSSSAAALALIETENKDNGDTPLHVAVMLGNFKVVELILDHINNIEIIRRLLQKPNKKNNTVLHEAVKNGNLDIVKLLLEKDSSLVNSNNEDGESPLFLAVDRELYEIASHILSKIEYVGGILSEEKGSWSGRNGLNVMHAAVIRNKGLTNIKKRNKIKGDGMIEKLLEKYGNDILKGKDDHGWSPLHYAAHLNEFGLVNKFLSKPSLICCVQDNENMSPLHIAAKNGSLEALQSLKNGSGLYSYKMFELLDKNKRTALHVAVESKHTFLVERMLCFEESKYIINWKDKDGNTCFHLAALTKSSKMVLSFILFQRKFTLLDKAAVNNKGMTAIQIYSYHLESHSHQTPFWLLTPVYAKDFQWFKTSLESVHNVNGDKPKEEETRIVSLEPKQPNGERGSYNYLSTEFINVNLIVATIIATITFAAGVQIPGGYNDQGMAILRENPSFKNFIVSNSYGFSLSSASIHWKVLPIEDTRKKHLEKRFVFACAGTDENSGDNYEQ